MSLEALRLQEAAEAEILAARARIIGGAALSAATMAVAVSALASVSALSGGGIIGEPAADLRVLRIDTRLMQALGVDRMRAEAAAMTEILGALKAGYRTEAVGRAAAIEAQTKGLAIVVTITPEDLAALVDYPIQGHSPREVARHLVVLLVHGVDGALAAPLTGAIDPLVIPAALGDVARLHGDRLAAAAKEAYFAGTQAAERAVRAALVG